MQQRLLVGSRIRERRLFVGMRQADLARAAGISATYLNLIEHNRRRIGGKLLGDLARLLGVDVALLSDGTDSALLDSLRMAAVEMQALGLDTGAEVDHTGELAGRFPGWAQLIVRQQSQIEDLSKKLAALHDRATHDPFLPAALHDILSTVTAIRSTSSILHRTEDLEADWSQRFHRNLHEDSQRLTARAQGLVRYLEGAAEAETAAIAPQEAFERWLAGQGFQIAQTALVDGPIEGGEDLPPIVQSHGAPHLDLWRRDVAALPDETLGDALRDHVDPLVLSRVLQVDLDVVLRRLALAPTGLAAAGLIEVNGAGAITFRKPVEGFSVPRGGSACGLWPVYQALQRPGLPLAQRLAQGEQSAGAGMMTYAVARNDLLGDYDGPVVQRATMLLLPPEAERAAPSRRGAKPAAEPPQTVGIACRICAEPACAGRTEPSILRQGL